MENPRLKHAVVAVAVLVASAASIHVLSQGKKREVASAPFSAPASVKAEPDIAVYDGSDLCLPSPNNACSPDPNAPKLSTSKILDVPVSNILASNLRYVLGASASEGAPLLMKPTLPTVDELLRRNKEAPKRLGQPVTADFLARLEEAVVGTADYVR